MKDKRKIAIPIVLLVVISLTVWWLVRPRPFYYAGTVEATEVTLSARVSSVIQSQNVTEGNTVQKGQTLIELEGADLRLAADLAESEFQRGQRLYKGGSITKANLDQVRFKRDQAALRMAWCTISAPLDATVLHTYREPGEMVGPGMQLLTLGDMSEVWAYIYVEQTQLAQLSLGQEISGLLPELPNQSFSGKISVIRDKAEFTPKNVQTRSERSRLVYGVKVVFPNPDKTLKPGMTIEVKLPEVK